MAMFDLDDFYSLTRYAARFTADSDTQVTLYLSQKSTAAAVAACEMRGGDGSFRFDALPELYARADRDETTAAHEFVALTGCRCISISDGDVSADISIYNDFVAYLTAKGINV